MSEDKANYETSGAHRWDYNNNSTYPVEVKGDGGVAAKCKQKVREGLVKTKAGATTAAKKVKKTSWPDQWDYNNNSTNAVEVGPGGVRAKCKRKVGEGLVKTKKVASTGAKKVKVRASAGFEWIKEKCQKTISKR